MTELSKNNDGEKAKKEVSDAVDAVLYFAVNLKEQPPMAQLGVGAGFGTFTGYFVTKGGRIVAATVGLSFLLAQFAIHKGYITLNESKIERSIKNIKKSVIKKVSKTNIITVSDSFVTEYRWILGGFAAGLLIGFSIA